MALDQQAILQLLTQFQSGGAPPMRPTSGLEEPSLSGLRLGEQGMGLGGGGSLLGGSPGLGGGAEGPGLDLLTLLNALTQGAGTIGAPSQSLLQGIGGGLEPGFGAGGALGPQVGGVPQGTLGQAGVGGGQSAATVLALLKEAVGIGKTLTRTGQGAGSPGGSLPNIPDVSLGASLGQSPFFGGALGPSDLSTLTGTQPFGGTGFTPGELSQLTGTTPQSLFEGIGTPSNLLSLGGAGAPSGAELAAQFGARGGGEFGLADLAGGGGGTLLSPGNVLPGLGVLGNIGSGILGLTQGNIGGGAGTLGGTAAGLGLGAALAPETFGLSLLLGGLGGSAGGLLGSLFGGFGSPSVFEARRKNVGPTAQAGESALAGALTQGLDATPGIQSAPELLAALGVQTPDTFGGARNPVAVDLHVPPSQFAALGLPAPGPDLKAFGDQFGFVPFFFNPARATGGGGLVSPALLTRYLELVKKNPAALDFLVGSGDVAFQDQSASEALAARVKADAQLAIRRFLGLPIPTAAPSGPPAPAAPGPKGPVRGSADDELGERIR